MIHHPGTDRVHFDIALAGEEICLLLNNAGTEPALPECSTAFIDAINVLYVPLAKALHEIACTFLVLWRQQKVDVVGHQSIGMYRTVCAAGIVLQPLQVKAVVFIGEKACLAVVAALNEMQRYSWDYYAWSSWHSAISST
jgi:hypothetical protein